MGLRDASFFELGLSLWWTIGIKYENNTAANLIFSSTRDSYLVGVSLELNSGLMGPYEF